jgi:hypothetical protein
VGPPLGVVVPLVPVSEVEPVEPVPPLEPLPPVVPLGAPDEPELPELPVLPEPFELPEVPELPVLLEPFEVFTLADFAEWRPALAPRLEPRGPGELSWLDGAAPDVAICGAAPAALRTSRASAVGGTREIRMTPAFLSCAPAGARKQVGNNPRRKKIPAKCGYCGAGNPL